VLDGVGLAARSSRTAALAGALVSIVSVQAGAAIATDLFDQLSPPGVLLLRQGIGAIVLCAWARPHLGGFTLPQWRAVIGFAAAVAVMNLSIYSAIDRLPLGLAVTIELCGPLLLSAILARSRLDILWTVIAAAGIVLLRSTSLGARGGIGILFALLAGAGWAGYLVMSERAGRLFDDSTGLAVGLAGATLITVPFAVAGGLAPLGEFDVAWRGVTVALLSAVVPFTADLLVLRMVPTRVMSLLMALSPVVAAIIAWIWLAQSLSARQVVAMAAIVAAALGAVASAGSPGTRRSDRRLVDPELRS
jgi:inner membrane transporter RhtA